MLNLILWRHAQAEVGDKDLARRLTKKGRKQARKMAAFLREKLPEKPELWVSEAKRSRQTAAYLGRPTRRLAGLNPNVAAHDIAPILGECGENQTVIVVGHQPWIGDLAALLLNGNGEVAARSWAFKKGAIWWFEIGRTADDTLSVKLRMVMNPKDI